MKNKIEDLRNHLFGTLEALADPDKPMALDRAREIANVAQVLINSAKVEVAFIEAVGAKQGSGFIPQAASEPGPAPVTGPSGNRIPFVRN